MDFQLYVWNSVVMVAFNWINIIGFNISFAYYYILGMDCSVDVTRAHWSQVPFLSSSSISMDLLPRAGHSAVVMNSYMLVYSGYRFSGGRSNPYTSVREEVNIDAASFNAEGELLRYDMMSDKWEVLNTSSSLSDERAGHPRVDNGMEGGSGVWNVTDENSTESRPGFPGPRYGHSAVIYDVSFSVTNIVIPCQTINQKKLPDFVELAFLAFVLTPPISNLKPMWMDLCLRLIWC